jgi:hypothetical protein
MQAVLSGTFDSLIDAGARLLVTCVIGGAAIITARILQSRAKRLHYRNMPPRKVQLWTFAYDTVIWVSWIAIVLMFLLFIQEFAS